LKLGVPTAGDVFAFEDDESLPVLTTDTLDHDLSETDDGRIAITNECCDCTRTQNGILCTQEPPEGVWLFQGSQQSAVGSISNFGGVFGQQDVCGAFPTGTFSLQEEDYKHQNHVRANLDIQDQDTKELHKVRDTRLNLHKEKPCEHVLYFDPVTGKEVVDIDWDEEPQYVKFDESFLKHLESHDWHREYQIIELIPIINAVEHSTI
jgi:hypothetical protein